MKILRRVALIVFALAIVSFVKQDFLEGRGITPVYAHAESCGTNGQQTPSGQCDSTGQGYCFDSYWYTPGYGMLPDGSIAPTC